MMVNPGTVRHTGRGVTHLAWTPQIEDRLTEVAALLNAASFETRVVPDADSLLWRKLAVNCAINPLTALLGARNGFLVENETTRRLMTLVAEETSAVAEAQGIRLIIGRASKGAFEVATATAANMSSMAQDVARGAPTEIESINGAVVRIGEQNGVPTPFNEALLRLVKLHASSGNWRSEVPNLPSEVQPLIGDLALTDVQE